MIGDDGTEQMHRADSLSKYPELADQKKQKRLMS